MILLLGGTTEASALARLLSQRPGLPALLSLAGRTQVPATPPIAWRVGGFGGAEGLAAFLRENGIRAVVDATHPFAEQISANVAHACKAVGVPLLTLRRRPWQHQVGDRWIEVADATAAAVALGVVPRRVFLTVGRLELAPFLAATQHHYVIRTIDQPEHLPAGAELILARGPFEEADERVLMAERHIEVVVTKNSGGAATYAKIAAARALGLPVILMTPPLAGEGETVETAGEALAWIEGRAR